MTIDLEAIKQRWHGLVDGVNFTGRFRIALSGAQSAQLATDFKALVAEVVRLRCRLWAYISPMSNLHNMMCALTCADPAHYPEGDPEAPDDEMTARQVEMLTRDRWISVTEQLPAFRTSVLVSLRDATDADEESEELHGVLDEHGWQIVFRGPIGPPDVVTHWMPMIAPPSAEEKADETR